MATIAEQWMNQGREEGVEKGRLIGTIQTCSEITCSEILGEPVDEATLGSRALEELRRLADELQGRVRAKLSGQ